MPRARPQHQPGADREPRDTGCGSHREPTQGRHKRRRRMGRGARAGTAQARARRGLRGRLGLAARAALKRWTDPPAHTEGTPPWHLPRGAASLARWLRAWAGRRARPVARPESVESGLGVAANPAAPFARPALRPPFARPTRLPPIAQAPHRPRLHSSTAQAHEALHGPLAFRPALGSAGSLPPDRPQ